MSDNNHRPKTLYNFSGHKKKSVLPTFLFSVIFWGAFVASLLISDNFLSLFIDC